VPFKFAEERSCELAYPEIARGNLDYRRKVPVEDILGINEEEFFGFAKKYLSEAFPNPEWIDCPPDSEFTGLAGQPRQADPFVPQHITGGSPYFNRYMEILADLERRAVR